MTALSRNAKAAYYRANRDKWRRYYEANRVSILEYHREYREANRDKLRADARAHGLANRDKKREYNRKYYADPTNRQHKLNYMWRYYRPRPKKTKHYTEIDRSLIAATRCANRRAKKLKATPSWLTRDQFREINRVYRLASSLTLHGSHRFVVDHIVPLQSRYVCGLHVPWNLQILTRELNARKGNRLLPTA